MKGLLAQWKADIVRTSRDKRFFLLTLAMPVILYLVFANGMAGTAHQTGGAARGANLMVSMAAFGILASSVNTLAVRLAAERQNGWTAFLRTTPLSPVTYAVGKALTQLTLTLAVILTVFLIGHFYQGVTLTWTTWVAVGAWLWLASMPFAVLGILIGMTGSSAQVLGSLTYLVLAVLGGLLGKFSGTLQNVAQWLPTHYVVQPGWDLLQGRAPAATDVEVLAGYTAGFILISAFVQRWSAESEGGWRTNKSRWRGLRWVIIGLLALLWFLFHHHMI